MKKILFFLLIGLGASAQNMNPRDSTDYTQRNNLTHPGYNNGVYYFVNDLGQTELAAPRIFPMAKDMRSAWYPMPGILYPLHERGKEGWFRLSMRDSTSLDDGVNVILTGYGQRMKRVGGILSINIANRANQAGTQPASTISDFSSAVRHSLKASGVIQYDTASGTISYTPTLATVATTGNYNDLSNKPVINNFSGSYTDLTNTPAFAPVATSGNYNDLTNKPVISPAFSGNYNDLINRPTLSPVATTGTYASLTGIPSFSTVATSGAYADLTGKPALSTVATTGSYTDLTNRPVIPSAQIQSDWNQTTTTALDFIKNKPSLTWATITGKPTFATVATSGSYADLTNKPTIPAAQIQSDWNQTNTASLDFIKNKPQINTPVSTNVTRALNSSFQISTTRGAFVTYSVKITATITLVVGQTTTVFLETSPDGTTWTSMQSNEFGVNAGIALTMSNTVGVSGFVPQGYFVRIRTSGTAAAVYSSGNETLL